MLCGAYQNTDVPKEVDGIKVVQIPVASSNRDTFVKRAFKFLSFSLRATWVALRLDYDLVLATSTPLTVGLPAIAGKVLRKKRFIFEVRDLWPELPKAMGIIRNPVALGILDRFETLCYRTADACIGLAPGIVDGIHRKFPDKRVELIPNGCDLEIFKPAAANTGKRPEGVGQNDLLAIFCGAHGRANGLDAVLDAAAELLRRDRRDIKFLFVGDGQLKPHLMQRAEEEGLVNCLFRDAMPKGELAKLMASCDLGLMILDNVEAFQFGTSPNKFFDYISAGLPVLCNYPGWVSDLINSNQCGVEVHAGDPIAFADTMARLADSREQSPEMGQRARALAESEFNRDQLFARLSYLIHEVVGSEEAGRLPR